MDVVTEQECPKCKRPTSLNVYYAEHADLKIGAACKACGFKGFFVNNKLQDLPP